MPWDGLFKVISRPNSPFAPKVTKRSFIEPKSHFNNFISSNAGHVFRHHCSYNYLENTVFKVIISLKLFQIFSCCNQRLKYVLFNTKYCITIKLKENNIWFWNLKSIKVLKVWFTLVFSSVSNFFFPELPTSTITAAISSWCCWFTNAFWTLFEFGGIWNEVILYSSIAFWNNVDVCCCCVEKFSVTQVLLKLAFCYLHALNSMWNGNQLLCTW